MSKKVDNYGLCKFLCEVRDKLQPHTIFYGIGKNKDFVYENGVSAADILKIHTYGSAVRQIPIRDAMIGPVQKHKAEICKVYINIFDLISDEKDPVKRASEMAGRWLVSNVVKKEIQASGFGKWTPLKPATIRQKQKKGWGNNPMLVASGKMVNAIDNYVDKQLTKNNKLGNM